MNFRSLRLIILLLFFFAISIPTALSIGDWRRESLKDYKVYEDKNALERAEIDTLFFMAILYEQTDREKAKELYEKILEARPKAWATPRLLYLAQSARNISWAHR